jgi:hypothetical protein
MARNVELSITFHLIPNTQKAEPTGFVSLVMEGGANAVLSSRLKRHKRCSNIRISEPVSSSRQTPAARITEALSIPGALKNHR